MTQQEVKTILEKYGFKKTGEMRDGRKSKYKCGRYHFNFDYDMIYFTIYEKSNRVIMPVEITPKEMACVVFFTKLYPGEKMRVLKHITKGSNENVLKIYDWLADFKDLRDLKYGNYCRSMSFLFEEIDDVLKDIKDSLPGEISTPATQI